MTPAIRAIVRELDRNVAVTEVASMDQIVSQALGSPRFAASVFGVFGLVALVLAALGVYGLLGVLRDMPHAGDWRSNGAWS